LKENFANGEAKRGRKVEGKKGEGGLSTKSGWTKSDGCPKASTIRRKTQRRKALLKRKRRGTKLIRKTKIKLEKARHKRPVKAEKIDQTSFPETKGC